MARVKGGVVLLTQADMFDVTVANPQIADYSAFKPIVQAIIDRSSRFAGPVYLFNGDSHVYNSDKPLAAGSRWLSFSRNCPCSSPIRDTGSFPPGSCRYASDGLTGLVPA